MKIGERRTKEYEYNGFVFLAIIERVPFRPGSMRHPRRLNYNCSIKNLGTDNYSSGDSRIIDATQVRGNIDMLVSEAKYWVDSLNEETDEFLFMEEEGFRS
jgi:hypothetical protein